MANLDNVTKEIRETNVGSLRIAAYPSSSMALLPQVVARFRKSHPEVQVSLITHQSPKVTELLNKQQYDIGVTESPVAQEHIEIERFRLRCLCMVPPAHRLAAREVIRPRDLDGELFIRAHPEHPTTLRLAELWAAEGIRPWLDMETQLYWTA